MLNKVMILGRLGQDPELKYTQNGNAVCTLSIATSKRWTGKDGQQNEKTEWHRVVVWGRQAENCNQYLRKGSQAFVEGEIETRSWETDDGIRRYSTEINARDVKFMPRTDGQTTGKRAEPQAKEEQQVSADFATDEIPF